MVDKESFMGRMKQKAQALADAGGTGDTMTKPDQAGDDYASGEEPGSDSDIKQCLADMESLMSKVKSLLKYK